MQWSTAFGEVGNFKYLESKIKYIGSIYIININGKIQEEITERIKGRFKFYHFVCDILINWNLTGKL